MNKTPIEKVNDEIPSAFSDNEIFLEAYWNINKEKILERQRLILERIKDKKKWMK